MEHRRAVAGVWTVQFHRTLAGCEADVFDWRCADSGDFRRIRLNPALFLPAQNTTPAQMKMFLTRIGFGSKVIVTGDASQKDLPSGTRSGLDVAMQVLKKVDGISFCELTSKDVVRHPLVQKIVQAYDEYEKKAKPENHSGRAKSTTRKRRENK